MGPFFCVKNGLIFISKNKTYVFFRDIKELVESADWNAHPLKKLFIFLLVFTRFYSFLRICSNLCNFYSFLFSIFSNYVVIADSSSNTSRNCCFDLIFKSWLMSAHRKKLILWINSSAFDKLNKQMWNINIFDALIKVSRAVSPGTKTSISISLEPLIHTHAFVKPFREVKNWQTKFQTHPWSHRTWNDSLSRS
jgi:hypothetical protein